MFQISQVSTQVEKELFSLPNIQNVDEKSDRTFTDSKAGTSHDIPTPSLSLFDPSFGPSLLSTVKNSDNESKKAVVLQKTSQAEQKSNQVSVLLNNV